jgi:hypothetical protein
VAPKGPREQTLVLSLDLVIEFISDTLTHLAEQRSRVGTRRQPLEDRTNLDYRYTLLT